MAGASTHHLSTLSNSLRARERVKWYAIIDNKEVNDSSRVQTQLFTYLIPNKNGGDN